MIMKKKSDRKETPWTSSFKIGKNVESLNEKSDWKGIAVDGEDRRNDYVTGQSKEEET